jgi:uncharacterized protein
LKDWIFHQAVPCNDLGRTVAFYTRLPRCRVARTYDDRVTFEFFGHQLVCHLDREYRPPRPTVYPRHFGITFEHRDDFDAVLQTAEQQGLPFLAAEFIRFEGRREEHRTFLLLDPADNVLEFKYYHDPTCMY